MAGFEPVEMLDAVYEIVKQANNKNFHIVNKYRRVVPDIGNANAREILAKVFYESDAFWRGLGELKCMVSGEGTCAAYYKFLR